MIWTSRRVVANSGSSNDKKVSCETQENICTDKKPNMLSSSKTNEKPGKESEERIEELMIW